MEQYTLVLTTAQLNIIDKALRALTLGEAFNVYVDIKSQIEGQPKKQDSNISAG